MPVDLPIETFNRALQLAESNKESQEIVDEMRNTLQFLIREKIQDAALSVDHPERLRYNQMLEWLHKGGAQFDKLKLRYYSDDYRGVHAARNIRKDETILFVPLKMLLTLDMAMVSPIGAKMAARNFRNRLISPKHSFLSTLLMEEFCKPDS